jgi:hypothetical protein
LFAINFDAKASLGLDDFDHDMLHFPMQFSALISAQSRQIDSLSSIHQSIGRSARDYAVNLRHPAGTQPKPWPEPHFPRLTSASRVKTV